MVNREETTQVSVGDKFYVGEMKHQHPHLDYLRTGAIVCLFDGLDTMLDYIEREMPTAKESRSSVNGEGGSFNAFPSYKKAMDTFRNHPEEVAKFDASELRIKDESESGSTVDYDVVGDYVDMGRFMEGVPESVGTMHNGNARNRRANIIINLTHMGGIGHKPISHRGERILRLVDALEAGGVRTMITAIESSQCAHAEVILKRHDEPLTINDLAVVSHPEFLRRPIFRITEYSKTFESGYGNAVVFSRKLTPERVKPENNDEMVIVIDGNFSQTDNIDQQFDKLEKLLVWEMSKPVPEVSSIKVDREGVRFDSNGYRSADEVRREGREVLKDD